MLRKWNAPEASRESGAAVAGELVIEFDLGAGNDAPGGSVTRPSIVPAAPEDCAEAEIVNAKNTSPANAG